MGDGPAWHSAYRGKYDQQAAAALLSGEGEPEAAFCEKAAVRGMEDRRPASSPAPGGSDHKSRRAPAPGRLGEDLDPCWMLDVVGCCWMLLGVVGCCWMLLGGMLLDIVVCC